MPARPCRAGESQQRCSRKNRDCSRAVSSARKCRRFSMNVIFFSHIDRSALIEAVYDAAHQHRAERAHWQTHETNHTAMRLYDSVAGKTGAWSTGRSCRAECSGAGGRLGGRDQSAKFSRGGLMRVNGCQNGDRSRPAWLASAAPGSPRDTKSSFSSVLVSPRLQLRRVNLYSLPARTNPPTPPSAQRSGRNPIFLCVRHQLIVQSHGFTMATPVAAKSATLRVTTVMPCTSAVAAMSASRSDRRSGTWSRAHR